VQIPFVVLRPGNSDRQTGLGSTAGAHWQDPNGVHASLKISGFPEPALSLVSVIAGTLW